MRAWGSRRWHAHTQCSEVAAAIGGCCSKRDPYARYAAAVPEHSHAFGRRVAAARHRRSRAWYPAGGGDEQCRHQDVERCGRKRLTGHSQATDRVQPGCSRVWNADALPEVAAAVGSCENFGSTSAGWTAAVPQDADAFVGQIAKP